MSTEKQQALDAGLPILLSEVEVWPQNDVRAADLGLPNAFADDEADLGEESCGPPAASSRETRATAGVSPLARIRAM